MSGKVRKKLHNQQKLTIIFFANNEIFLYFCIRLRKRNRLYPKTKQNKIILL